MRDYVLAFDFGGTKTSVATAHLNGELIHRDTFSTVECGDGDRVLKKAIAVGKTLCTRAPASDPDARLMAIGVSSMGVTFADRVEMAPNVPGWSQLRIEESFRTAFDGVQVRVENDVKTATLAELRRGALRGTDSGLYVNLGTGIAVGYTLGNQVVRGHNGSAGEIAYLLVDKNETHGFSSGVTPLENYVGGAGIARRATQQFGRSMTARKVFELATEDECIRAFRDDLLRVLACHVTNTVIQWDPEKVVIGGGMVAAKDVIFPLLSTYFSEFVPFPPIVEESAFLDEASIYGAVELARDITQSFVEESFK